MAPDPGNVTAVREDPPRAIAFSVHASRNIVVQAIGLGMVILTCLNVTPWPYVAGWTLTAVTVLFTEDRLLRTVAKGGRNARQAAAWAPVLRIAATTMYALAAFVLIARGGGNERLFAFALITASMVHVLMRYYRSRWTLIGALAPYVAVLGMVAINQVRLALLHGNGLAAVIATFTLGTFALQFWSARAQLAAAWDELMTARQAAEERERAAEVANRAKSNFLATMSHELRTPLNGVLGMAQALTTERLTQAQHERVKIIRRSSETLLTVLNDLLDLSKIEASALELEMAEFDLEHLVRGVAAVYRPLAHKKGLSFDFDLAEAVAGRYLGDAGRIRRVLYNLAENAVKFTDAGQITLSVGREGGEIAFRVTDTGIGIAPQDLTHLFDDFFQADPSLTRRYGGVGLGLALCRELSSLMGGVVEATSTLGKGSTFVLRIPLTAVAAAHAPPAPDPQPSGEIESPADLRVLAAEDNATNQLVLKTLLAQVGITPTMVENGREAVAAWESRDWDIVLMDIQMPEMDGVAATRAIRRREQETGRARTPILAVTANAMTHQVAEYEAAGMDNMVPKPIDVATLFQAMEAVLAQPATAEQASAA